MPPLLERRDLIGALARLDRRLVPALQRRSREAARTLGSPLRSLARLEDRRVPGLVRQATRHWRLGVLLLAALGVLGSAVHLQRFPELREARRAEQRAADAPRPRPVEGPAPAGEAPPTVGPAQGDDVEEYVAARRAALATLPDDGAAVAVVSFRSYLRPDEIRDLLPGELTVTGAQYRLPAEGEVPSHLDVPDGDLTARLDRAIEQAMAPLLTEIGEVRTLLESGTVDDPAFERDLERRLSELQAVRNLLDSGHKVVFAVVVEGPVAALRELSGHDAVRLVDPAPAGEDPDGDDVYGLLPEDRERASFGRPG